MQSPKRLRFFLNAAAEKIRRCDWRWKKTRGNTRCVTAKTGLPNEPMRYPMNDPASA
jgi:hypothetical protein